IRAAGAPVCTDVATVRLVDGERLSEFSHLSLGGAPLATLGVGGEAVIGGRTVEIRARGGAIRGRIDAVADERHWMPLAQLELALGDGSTRFLARGGAVRSIVLLQRADPVRGW